jgi:protein gp37
LGISVENQVEALSRIPKLLQTSAAMRFISFEPLLGPLDLREWIHRWVGGGDVENEIRWVIVGGESGPYARRMDLSWARSLRDQCKEAGVPFFMKQLGSVLAREMGLKARAGEDPAEWPEDLRVREFPRGVESRP